MEPKQHREIDIASLHRIMEPLEGEVKAGRLHGDSRLEKHLFHVTVVPPRV